MKTPQYNKYGLKVGTIIDVYYSNGSCANTATVTRMNEKSCWLSNYGGHRESWNTINTNIDSGIYKINSI
jgi:hypothetical protein